LLLLIRPARRGAVRTKDPYTRRRTHESATIRRPCDDDYALFTSALLGICRREFITARRAALLSPTSEVEPVRPFVEDVVVSGRARLSAAAALNEPLIRRLLAGDAAFVVKQTE